MKDDELNQQPNKNDSPKAKILIFPIKDEEIYVSADATIKDIFLHDDEK